MPLKFPLIFAGVVLACAPMLSLAQTTPPAAPAKAASAAKAPSIVVPKAAAKPPPKTLGGATAGGGKVMSRDELRSCMKRQDELNATAKEIDALRPALDKDRSELQSDGDALKAERAEVERRLAAVREFETRMRAYAADIDAFNKRSATVEEAPRREQDQIIAALKTERARLETAKQSLEADQARVVPAYQAAVAGFNERATVRDAKVASWNARNVAAQDAAAKHDDSRGTWRTDCANRSYNEDDEIAIKAGK